MSPCSLLTLSASAVDVMMIGCGQWTLNLVSFLLYHVGLDHKHLAHAQGSVINYYNEYHVHTLTADLAVFQVTASRVVEQCLDSLLRISSASTKGIVATDKSQ